MTSPNLLFLKGFLFVCLLLLLSEAGFLKFVFILSPVSFQFYRLTFPKMQPRITCPLIGAHPELRTTSFNSSENPICRKILCALADIIPLPI